MLTTIGSVLAGLIGAGIFSIGASYFWAPQVASGFGIPHVPVDDPAGHHLEAITARYDGSALT